jgi:hypothetical protein
VAKNPLIHSSRQKSAFLCKLYVPGLYCREVMAMLRYVVFSVICAVLFSQCDLWNRPLTRSDEEYEDLLRIRSIYVTELPSPNVFTDNDSARPETAEGWSGLGLVVYAVDGFGQNYPIEAGSQYEFAGETPPHDKQKNLTEVMPVNVTLQLLGNNEIKTSFAITLVPSGETYYKIEPYTDEGGQVIAYPSMVSKSQIQAGDVAVMLYVYPAYGYVINGSPWLIAESTPPPPIPPNVGTDNTFTMIDCGLKIDAEFLYIADKEVKLQSNKRYYNTLNDAITAAADGDTVTALKNIGLDSGVTIKNGRHINLIADGNVTIGRETEFTDSLFTVQNDASLTLGGGGGELIINGGAVWNEARTSNSGITAQAALVNVTGGHLFLKNGASLRNNETSGHGGAVYIESGGSFSMSGGKISGNKGGDGGGVYISQTSIFNMTGGSIEYNTGFNGGGVNLGSNDGSNNIFNFSGGLIQYNAATSPDYGGGGVTAVGGGVVNVSGTAQIMKNTSAGNGGGVSVQGATFNKTGGGIIYGTGAGEDYANTANGNTNGDPNGHAVYVSSDVSSDKKRNSTVRETEDLYSKDANGWDN